MSAAGVTRVRALFTVIIPTHNRPDLLEEAVTSVLQQRRVDVECLIVDDGSAVAVGTWDDPRVRIVRHPEPLGAAEARNTGIRNARGSYVSFLDDDDRYLPTRLDAAAEHVSKGIAVVCWSRSMKRSTRPGRLLYGNEFDRILDDSTPQVGTITLLRDDCPRFDVDLELNEDIDWWLRVAERCRFLTVPLPLHLFREHEGPRLTDRVRERLRCSWLLIDKHAEYFVAHPKALAFRLRRMGLIALKAGWSRQSCEYFVRSFLAQPSFKAFGHLIRAGITISRSQLQPKWSTIRSDSARL